MPVQMGQKQSEMDAEVFRCDGKDVDFDYVNYDFDRIGIKKLV